MSTPNFMPNPNDVAPGQALAVASTYSVILTGKVSETQSEVSRYLQQLNAATVLAGLSAASAAFWSSAGQAAVGAIGAGGYASSAAASANQISEINGLANDQELKGLQDQIDDCDNKLSANAKGRIIGEDEPVTELEDGNFNRDEITTQRSKLQQEYDETLKSKRATIDANAHKGTAKGQMIGSLGQLAYLGQGMGQQTQTAMQTEQQMAQTASQGTNEAYTNTWQTVQKLDNVDFEGWAVAASQRV